MLQNIQSDQKTFGTSFLSSFSEEGKETRTSAPPTVPNERSLEHWWRVVKRYPIPCGAIALMAVSLCSGLPGLVSCELDAACGRTPGGSSTLVGNDAAALAQGIWHRCDRPPGDCRVSRPGTIPGRRARRAHALRGEALEAYALRRARSSLSSLAERAPRVAHIWQGDELVTIAADQVDVGMEIVVKPGELIPVDGVVISGSSSVSEADLTGEPVPVRKAPGMLILSGSVNLDGVLNIRASKRSADSKYAQIVRLVEEAQTQKAPIHRLADRYSVGFTLSRWYPGWPGLGHLRR